MNMYLHELRDYSKSTFIWTCSLVVLIILFLSMFPAIAKDAGDFKKMLQNYPQSVLKAMGLYIDQMFTLLGYYSNILIDVVMFASVQAMNLGTSIISKEVRDKTADFLLTKPVSRAQIMTAKILAALTCLVITNVFYLTAATFMALVVKTEAFSVGTFILISLTIFYIQLMFLAIGILVSVILPKIRSVLPISLSTVFGFFVLGMITTTAGEKYMRYISPFKYFDLMYIINNAGYESLSIILAFSVTIIAIACSFIIYIKKDIHAV